MGQPEIAGLAEQAGIPAESLRIGMAGAPSHPLPLLVSSIHDCRSCLPSSELSVERLSLDSPYQAQMNPTISQGYPVDAARSQLDPPVAPESRGGGAESRGAPVESAPLRTGCWWPGATFCVYSGVEPPVDACDCAAVTDTYAHDAAGLLAPYVVREQGPADRPGGTPPLSLPEAPTPEINTNPSASAQGVTACKHERIRRRHAWRSQTLRVACADCGQVLDSPASTIFENPDLSARGVK